MGWEKTHTLSIGEKEKLPAGWQCSPPCLLLLTALPIAFLQGFAFISFHRREDAARAIAGVSGFGYDHLILNVEWAK